MACRGSSAAHAYSVEVSAFCFSIQLGVFARFQCSVCQSKERFLLCCQQRVTEPNRHHHAGYAALQGVVHLFLFRTSIFWLWFCPFLFHKRDSSVLPVCFCCQLGQEALNACRSIIPKQFFHPLRFAPMVFPRHLPFIVKDELVEDCQSLRSSL